MRRGNEAVGHARIAAARARFHVQAVERLHSLLGRKAGEERIGQFRDVALRSAGPGTGLHG